MRTTAFLASVVANVILVALLVLQPMAPKPEAEQPPTVTPASVSGFDVEGSSTPVVVRARLAAAGFSEDAIKPMLLGWLEARAKEESPLPALEYWRNERAEHLAIAARERQLDIVGRGLREVYGTNALEDKAFEEVALLQRAAAANPSRSLQTPVGGVDDTTTTFESELRESPFAAQLRSSGVDFTEQEFRDTFRLIREFQANPSPEKLAEHRSQIRALLGRDRALRVAASSDPGFRTIQEISDRHRLGSDMTFAAYEIVLDAQERMLGIMKTGADDLRRAADMRAAIQDRDRRLERLLGESVARDLVHAQIASVRLSNVVGPATN
jgi:hypothetical protein